MYLVLFSFYSKLKSISLKMKKKTKRERFHIFPICPRNMHILWNDELLIKEETNENERRKQV